MTSTSSTTSTPRPWPTRRPYNPYGSIRRPQTPSPRPRSPRPTRQSSQQVHQMIIPVNNGQFKDSPDRIDSHYSYSLISLPTPSDAHSLPRSRLSPIMNLKIEWTPVGTTLKFESKIRV